MRLAGANKGVEQPVPNLIREKLTIDEVSPKKTGQAEKLLPPVKSYRAERKENVLWTFLANEPAGVGQYGVKINSIATINYRNNYFMGGPDVSGSFRWQSLPRFFRGTLFRLSYGTWETAYKCQGKCTIRTT